MHRCERYACVQTSKVHPLSEHPTPSWNSKPTSTRQLSIPSPGVKINPNLKYFRQQKCNEQETARTENCWKGDKVHDYDNLDSNPNCSIAAASIMTYALKSADAVAQRNAGVSRQAAHTAPLWPSKVPIQSPVSPFRSIGFPSTNEVAPNEYILDLSNNWQSFVPF